MKLGMKGDDIADRLLEFAACVLRIVARLPNTPRGKHIARQLIRSGTSGGANYEEARGAESRADFAHKVSLALKEVRESVYWLRLILHVKLDTEERQLANVVQEGNELAAILRSSAATDRKRVR